MSGRDGNGRFVNGAKPGLGRPKGARNKLGEEFSQALADDISKHGSDAVKRCREEESPAVYVRTIVGLLLREINAPGVIERMSEAEIEVVLEALDATNV